MVWGIEKMVRGLEGEGGVRKSVKGFNGVYWN